MREEALTELELQGLEFSFSNNSHQVGGELFSKASAKVLSWVTSIEDFVLFYYGKDSPPYRLFLTADPRELDGYERRHFEKQLTIFNAVIQACKSIPVRKSTQSPISHDLLTNVLDKFHDVAKLLRNRHDGRPTLDVVDEYDVQDLLYALIRMHFSDVRKEEWTPSYAGGAARMDFLLKVEQTVIEVKKTRKGLGDKDLGKQLIEDRAKYQQHQDCKKLICFVYDPDGRILNPKGIQNDLNSIGDDFSIEIVIKP